MNETLSNALRLHLAPTYANLTPIYANENANLKPRIFKAGYCWYCAVLYPQKRDGKPIGPIGTGHDMVAAYDDWGKQHEHFTQCMDKPEEPTEAMLQAHQKLQAFKKAK